MDRHEPSESSPLLQTTAAPASTGPSSQVPHGITTANGHGESIARPADGGESQASREERVAQYQGMPEVKEKLKYILPAIGIGVRAGLKFMSSPLT